MKKITAKFINDNLDDLANGWTIHFRGAEYWMRCDGEPASPYREDRKNGTIYYIDADRKISGCINGYEYAKVINGVAYKI